MATMNKPSQGDTNWFTPVDNNWTALEKATSTGEGLTINGSTPTQITASQNDYGFSGGTAANILQRLSSDASRNITGISGGADGKQYVLANVGSFDIALTNDDASSSAANRIYTGTGATLTLAPNELVEMVYDSVSSRWRCGAKQMGIVPISSGGTGASTAAGARTNLDVPSNSEAILDAIIDAKGDLIVGQAADTPAKLIVGSPNQALIVDSGETTGVKWGTLPIAGGGTGATTDAGARANLGVPSNTEAILDAIIDAKGDLIVGTAADTPAKLSVGSQDQALIVDSG